METTICISDSDSEDSISKLSSKDVKPNKFYEESDFFNLMTSNQLDESKSSSQYRKRSYSCDKCEYKGSRLDLLKRHLNKCKGTKESKLFKCDICDYSTCRKRHLKRHKLIHGGKRPYTCGICSKGFTEMNHIKSHMFKHSNSPLPFKCIEKDCDSSFSRKCDLNIHMIKHVKPQTYICDICKNSFLKKDQLSRHIHRIHKKIKEDE